MIVIARKVNFDECPSSIESFGFAQPSNVRVIVGKQYIVYAISIFRAVVFFQVVDNLDRPGWYPSWFFDNSDMTLPDDWICNVQHDDPQLIIGPSFVAKTEDAYNAMVQLEPESVKLFWEQVNIKMTQEK